jgi:hypothetical protein
LTRAGECSLQAVHDRAFAALYLGRLSNVRELLTHEATQGTQLATLVDGPFRARFPNAAEVLEARSADGHYRVITDLGLTRTELSALEQKLVHVSDPTERAEAIDRARRKHRGLKELCDVMEKAYKAYDKLFGPDRPGEVVPTVIVFSDRMQFDAFGKRLQIGSVEHALGYYHPRYRVLVFYDQDEGDRRRGNVISPDTMETLLHETFHQWLHLYVPDAPRWFDEGLAEYFGIAQLTKNELRYGLIPQTQPSRLTYIRLALNGDGVQRPWPLQRLLNADAASFMHPNMSGVNYAQAWSFAHFLGSSAGGQKLLRDYFGALRDGADQATAYDRVFAAIDLGKLELEWRQHVGKMR